MTNELIGHHKISLQCKVVKQYPYGKYNLAASFVHSFGGTRLRVLEGTRQIDVVYLSFRYGYQDFGNYTCTGSTDRILVTEATTTVLDRKHHLSEGAARSSEVERSLMVRWVVGSILHGVDPLSYFSFQPVFHDWCNKGRGMCYPVCGMVHIKEPLLLIDKSSLCGGSGFPFSLSEWSLTICLTPYNHS